jgi:hypothetical protein
MPAPLKQEVDKFFSYYQEPLTEDDFFILYGEEFCDNFTEEEVHNGTMNRAIEQAYNEYKGEGLEEDNTIPPASQPQTGTTIGEGTDDEDDDEGDPINPFGAEHTSDVERKIRSRVVFDGYDMNNRPLFIPETETSRNESWEWTIDELGNIWKHDGFTDKIVGKLPLPTIKTESKNNPWAICHAQGLTGDKFERCVHDIKKQNESIMESKIQQVQTLLEKVTGKKVALVEKEKQLSDVKVKHGKMHKILGLKPGTEIHNHYKSGASLGDALSKKVGADKAKKMLAFAGNIHKGSDIFDAALNHLKGKGIKKESTGNNITMENKIEQTKALLEKVTGKTVTLVEKKKDKKEEKGEKDVPKKIVKKDKDVAASLEKTAAGIIPTASIATIQSFMNETLQKVEEGVENLKKVTISPETIASGEDYYQQAEDLQTSIKQIVRMVTYVSNTIKAKKFDATLLDKIINYKNS